MNCQIEYVASDSDKRSVAKCAKVRMRIRCGLTRAQKFPGPCVLVWEG